VRSLLYWQPDGVLGRIDVLAHEAVPDGLAVAAAWVHTVSRSPKAVPDGEVKKAKSAASDCLEQVFWALCEALPGHPSDAGAEPVSCEQDVKTDDILASIPPPYQPYVLQALALLLERRRRLRRLRLLGLSPQNQPVGPVQSERQPKAGLSASLAVGQDRAVRHILYLHPPTGLQVAVPLRPWPPAFLPLLQEHLGALLEKPNNLT
jgi:hypothetical protein